MTQRPLKLGVTLIGLDSVPEMVEAARQAEAAGFEVVLLPDHLGFTAPLVPLVAIAEAAPTVKVSNLVLNSSFYRPHCSPRPGQRGLGQRRPVDHLAGHRVCRRGIRRGRNPFPAPEPESRSWPSTSARSAGCCLIPVTCPHPYRPRRRSWSLPRDKMLTLAAQQADIVAIASMGTEADLAGRVAFVEEKAGDRFDDIELQFGFFQVSMDDPNDLSVLRLLEPDAPEEEVRKLTTLLDGLVPAAAERIQRLHEELGISTSASAKPPARPGTPSGS